MALSPEAKTKLIVFLVVVVIILFVLLLIAVTDPTKLGRPAFVTKAAFTDMLEATLAPGAQQRYDTSLSHTGADVHTENQKLNAARALATPPMPAKSGLTGSREAPYFPEGSMYNIEGKRTGAAVVAGEGFRSKFDAAKLEENVYG